MLRTDIVRILTSEDGQKIYPLLVEYASLRIGARILPKKLEPRDLAAEAIESLLDGKRRWDSEKVPDLFYFLKRVVDSKLSHLFELAEHKKRQDISSADEQSLDDPIDTIPPDQIKDTNPTGPFEELEAKELKDYLWKQAEGDEELELLLLCLENGMERREIAEELAWPPKKVDNVRKRIKRIYLKYPDN